MTDPETLLLPPGTKMPNSLLPVLIYRKEAGSFDELFVANGWTGIWHDGVYDYDHYHSNAHEVLGVSGGWARLQLGGDEGRAVEVQKGDVVILPAGTGHRRIEKSNDFAVYGAYPPGQDRYDILRDRSAEADLRISKVPLPSTDPVRGAGGPLTQIWR
jgi:uncharacterized protein YjlB